ncbi:MAG: DegV family protein [Candidatus Roseilinea sp.]|uniref:DegV family protein n=1 Tax=Candidatus Roseilinea sp. TaxID=2838777 RepID=UPI00404B1289
MKLGNSRSPRRLKIITDSTAQIAESWARDHQVLVMAQRIRFGGKVYREGVDLDDAAFARLVQGRPASEWPVIEAPSVEDYSEIYHQTLLEASDIIVMAPSHKLTHSARNARMAAEMFRGRANIVVFDSQTIALGLNVLVRQASALTQDGYSIDDIIKLARGLTPRLYGAFVTQDLSHVARSGCLRPAQAALGELLGIIPFLSIEEGEMAAIEKVRSFERALQKLVEFAAEFESPQELAVLQLSPQANAHTDMLIDLLRGIFPGIGHIPVRPCGATLGSIIGPTGIGIMIYD